MPTSSAHSPSQTAPTSAGRVARLAVAAGLNGGFGAVQVAVGIIAGSVAVLADAAHQAVDMIGLLLALAAAVLARRPATTQMTYGWTKFDALGSYTSCLVLLASVVWIVIESIERLRAPVEFSTGPVIAVGAIGIGINALGVILLGGGHDLSSRAARLHLITDLAGSVLVLVAGAAVAAGLPFWLDPVVSLVITVLVIGSAGRLMILAGRHLLDSAPREVSAQHLAEVLTSHPDVSEAHHIHVRTLDTHSLSGSAHVVIDGGRSVHETQLIADQLTRTVADRLGIDHATLQFECHPCADLEHVATPVVADSHGHHHH